MADRGSPADRDAIERAVRSCYSTWSGRYYDDYYRGAGLSAGAHRHRARPAAQSRRAQRARRRLRPGLDAARPRESGARALGLRPHARDGGGGAPRPRRPGPAAGAGVGRQRARRLRLSRPGPARRPTVSMPRSASAYCRTCRPRPTIRGADQPARRRAAGRARSRRGAQPAVRAVHAQPLQPRICSATR